MLLILVRKTISVLLAVPLASWKLETDENGYARAHDIHMNKAGQYIVQFVATIWGDTFLEASSAPFEVVPGPATAAAFSLKPPSRVLLREPFSAVVAIVDSNGNQTARPPNLLRGKRPVEVNLRAFNEAGQEVVLNGQITRVWSGGQLSFEGLWLSEPGHVFIKARRC